MLLPAIRHDLPPCYRLRQAADFSCVFDARISVHGQWLQLYLRPNDLGRPRLGLVVGKRLSKRAVRRNYMKRVIREHFRMSAQGLLGIDVVVRPKQLFGRADAAMVRVELTQLWRKVVKRCPVSPAL